MQVSELRPKLARARQCVDRAAFEPALMLGQALDVPGWLSILSATETLLNRWGFAELPGVPVDLWSWGLQAHMKGALARVT